jgi:sec-independent protein translocase protein TatC
MRRVKTLSYDDEVSLVEHLDELRARVVVSLSVFGVAFALCIWQSQLLLELANGPLPSSHDRLLTLGITEPFTTTMTVAAYGAFVLSMPIVLYQVYAYVLPALSRQARRRRTTPRSAPPAAAGVRSTSGRSGASTPDRRSGSGRA